MYLNTLIILIFVNILFAHGMSLMGDHFFMNNFDKYLNFSKFRMKWITQPVDHFNATDTRKWNMRYIQNMESFKPGGPIYISINDVISPNGVLYDLASETNGAMFASEHRYYGDSQPFEKQTTENLQYLSSRQALADLATLIKNLTSSTPFKSAKVVVIGGWYAGNLAAWMRLLYPDIVDAAIASSAPVLAKINFTEYLETVGDELKKYSSPDCFDEYNERFSRYVELFKSESGINQLKIEENICETTNMSKWENQAFFYNNMVADCSFFAEYGSPDDIRDLCDDLGSSDYSLAGKAIIYDDCYDYEFNDWIQYINIPWIYQMCTEFGYFKTPPKNQPFIYSIADTKYYYMVCSKFFGPDFNEARLKEGVRKTNEMYGGLNPNVTNVVFVNGEIDPWRRLGIVKDLSDKAPAIMIPGASHVNDLRLYSPDDTEELKKAREQEKSFIKKWISK